MLIDHLLLGMDSAVIGVAAAPLLGRSPRRWCLAAACGATDGVASLVGTLLGHSWRTGAETLPAVLLAAYGAVVMVIGQRLRRAADTPATSSVASAISPPTMNRLRTSTLVVLPVALSVDNLLVPISGLDPIGALGLAISSAGMMVVGLAVGTLVPIRGSAGTAWAGAGFVVAGVLAVLG